MLLNPFCRRFNRIKPHITHSPLFLDARPVSFVARSVAIAKLERQTLYPRHGKYILVQHELKPYPRTVILRNSILELLRRTNIFSTEPPKMESLASSQLLLEKVRGMKSLDRDAFKCTVSVPSLVVPFKSMKTMQKQKGKITVLRRRLIKPLVQLEDTDPRSKTHKRMLLDPIAHPDPESLPKDELASFDVDIETWSMIDVELGYENFNHSEILKAVLPVDSDGVAGFTQTGHIVHVNLREECLDYKEIIGQVILDKVSQAKTVVNKANCISNEFRTFEVELIAGEDKFVTEVKRKNGLAFEFDFSKVFWNSRLETEHERIYDLLSSGDVVFDMFAGVGPFAVPAAKTKKKCCQVFANDINPDSYKWLVHNAKRNKASDNLHAFNKDGRDFARDVIKPELLKLWQRNDPFTKSIHIVMNLPALAVEFLDVFPNLMNGLIEAENVHHFVAPRVHCYSFSKAEDTKEDVRNCAEKAMNYKLNDCDIRVVRNVAPRKDMMYISFLLSKDLLLGDSVKEPDSKRQKLSQEEEGAKLQIDQAS